MRASSQSIQDRLSDAATVLLFSLSRPHDGSQMDEDMEGLLMEAQAEIANAGINRG